MLFYLDEWNKILIRLINRYHYTFIKSISYIIFPKIIALSKTSVLNKYGRGIISCTYIHINIKPLMLRQRMIYYGNKVVSSIN